MPSRRKISYEVKSIVYQAIINSKTSCITNLYVDLTENWFKTRFTNHKTSITHKAKQHSTELSKYIWQLKDKSANYDIKWKILKQAAPYNI